MRSCDPANRSPRADIASRVSSSQPPLILAWQTNSGAAGCPDDRSERARDPAPRSLSRASPTRKLHASRRRNVAKGVVSAEHGERVDPVDSERRAAAS